MAEEATALTEKEQADAKDNPRIIYGLLAARLPEEAVQRTEKSKTKKGYDTTGHNYQFVVDRFNEVVGFEEWSYDYLIIKTQEGKFSGGQPRFEITVQVSIRLRINGEWLQARSCVGSHVSMSYGDALKGAITNGFKKTAAFWGVGREAYAGTIDDDSKDQEHGLASPVSQETIDEAVSPPKPPPPAPAPPATDPTAPVVDDGGTLPDDESKPSLYVEALAELRDAQSVENCRTVYKKYKGILKGAAWTNFEKASKERSEDFPHPEPPEEPEPQDTY